MIHIGLSLIHQSLEFLSVRNYAESEKMISNALNWLCINLHLFRII